MQANQLTVEAIYAIANAHQPIEAGNEAFFAERERDMGAAWVAKFKDNIALEYFQLKREEQNAYAIDQALLADVYAAAKLLFARNASGKPFEFDASSAYDFCGSPWYAEIATPEQWVIHVARRRFADGEAEISADFAPELVQQAVETIADLKAIGVSDEAIEQHFADICHDNDQFKDALRAALSVKVA